MAVGNIKGFYVYDEENDESGIAHLATDAYADSSVTTAKLANGAVAEAKLATGAVTSGKIGNGSVGTAKLADEAVTSAKLADEAVTSAKLSDDVAETLDHKADQDGDYDDLTAGGAKQLLSTVYVDDKVPYNFRTSGGTADIGDRMYDEVVGGTVVWNQLLPPDYWVTSGVVPTSSNNYVFTADAQNAQAYKMFSKVIGHVYFAFVWFKTTNTDGSVHGRMWGVNYQGSPTTQWQCVHSFYKDTSGGGSSIGVQDSRTENWDGIKVKGFNCFDLTLMFGETIANYIYSLPDAQRTAFMKNLFPNVEYRYNAGSLLSVKAGTRKAIGFNAWDEETEEGAINMTPSALGEFAGMPGALRTKNFIKVLPNTSYHLSTKSSIVQTNVAIFWYNSEFDCLSYEYCGNSTVTSPPDAMYAKFYWSAAYGGTYLHDTSFHLAWDGEKDGTYEPYETHTYPLANIELRGIPKLDANNQLYYDGDTYASDGTVTRKYNKFTITAESINGVATSSTGIQYAIVLTPNHYMDNQYKVCAKYLPWWQNAPSESGYFRTVDTTTYIYDDSFTDIEAAKSKLVGVEFVAQLTEPTAETADAFTNPQIIDDFGTEEYVDYAYEAGDRDVAIPVGHNSQYMNNLRAKLEMAPESPSGDGKYIVQQSNGENAYIPYTADGRLDAIEAKLPAPPSTDGTYKLTATVTDGSVVYVWVAG